jgi:hypothetical protein
MDRAAVEQLLDEMISSLEDLETTAGATLQFLKNKGHATDEDLAPYLEQAGNASNVRWRAARLRMMSLLSSALNTAKEPEEKTKATLEPAETKSTPEPASAPPTGKAEDAPKEIPAELAQATKAKSSGDEQSADAGKNPEPDSTERKGNEQLEAEAEASHTESQPAKTEAKSDPRPTPSQTKQDAA